MGAELPDNFLDKYLKPLQEKFDLYPELAKKHRKEEPVTERQVVPYVDINAYDRVCPAKNKEKIKRSLTIFKEKSAKYKKGELLDSSENK
jgi:hypothetical protein